MGISEEIIAGLKDAIEKEFDGIPNRLASHVGVTVQQLGRWLRGETSPQIDKVGPVLDALGFQLTRNGVGRSQTRDIEFVNPKLVSIHVGTPPPASEDYFAVPLAEEAVAAGPGLIGSDTIRGWVIVWRHHDSIRFRSNLVAVEIGKGQTSMVPLLHSGDIVLVDRSERTPDVDGKIMLVCDPDGGCAIKRVSSRRIDGDTELVFYSDNAAANPPRVHRLKRDFGGNLDAAIGGRVVWAWSDMSRK